MGDAYCEGARVRVRPVQPEDAAHLARWKNDPLVREMALGPGEPATEAAEREEILRASGRAEEVYAIIELKEGDRPVGYIRVNWMDPEHEGAWLRFALGEERGQGLATEALRAYLGHLLEGGAHRVDAEVLEGNEASLRLLAKLGFVTEGRKRQAAGTGSGWADLLVLGLLAGELTTG